MNPLETRNIDPAVRKQQEADYQDVLAKMRRRFAKLDPTPISVAAIHHYYLDKIREAWETEFDIDENEVRLKQSFEKKQTKLN